MKKLLNKDLIKKSLKDLVALRNKIRKELFDHTLKNRMRALKQTHLIPMARKNVARINTAMTTIRLQESQESTK